MHAPSRLVGKAVVLQAGIEGASGQSGISAVASFHNASSIPAFTQLPIEAGVSRPLIVVLAYNIVPAVAGATAVVGFLFIESIIMHTYA